MPKRGASVDILGIAASLVKTGRYRNAAEVEAALRAKAPDSQLDRLCARQCVDMICFCARRGKKWQPRAQKAPPQSTARPRARRAGPPL